MHTTHHHSTRALILILCFWGQACAYDRAPATPGDDPDAGQVASDVVEDAVDLSVDSPSDLPAQEDLSPDLSDLPPEPVDLAQDPDSDPSYWTQSRCESVCAYQTSCLSEICADSNQTTSCVNLCMSDESYRDGLWVLARVDCASLLLGACQSEDFQADAACDCDSLSIPGDRTGDACATNAECTTSTWSGSCLAEGTGGYCTLESCTSHLECGAGNWCLLDQEDSSGCYQGCSPADGSACREGYACTPLETYNRLGVCAPACASDEECAGFEDRVCHRGACVEPIPCSTAEDCIADLRCVDGLCLSP